MGMMKITYNITFETKDGDMEEMLEAIAQALDQMKHKGFPIAMMDDETPIEISEWEEGDVPREHDHRDLSE
jgi:hypothetical protein